MSLPLICSNCGKDVTDGVRGRDWENYADLMVACAECLDPTTEESLGLKVYKIRVEP